MLIQALCTILHPLVNSSWSDSPETPNLGQIQRFLAPFDFVQHFLAIAEFKLELQSGNAQSGSNLTIFRAL